VMIGGMLAGTRPTPGKVVEENGKKVKQYRGMASFEAQQDFLGGVPEWKTAEGVSVTVPYREDEEAIIADIVGGLRSGLTYGGAASVKELQRKMNYVVVTQAGRIESMAHKAL
ncbi:MAG: IMP dehydrogenase, partial [Bdellovibrionota bacterium]